MERMEYGMLRPTNLTVDKENMCIDRSTPEGKLFEELAESARQKAGTPEGEFIAKILAFTEAALVVSETMEGEEAKKALDVLREEMNKA